MFINNLLDMSTLIYRELITFIAYNFHKTLSRNLNPIARVPGRLTPSGQRDIKFAIGWESLMSR
jgi:hypothetical protein